MTEQIQNVTRRVLFYQHLGTIHPLTCGNNSNHKLLVPRVRDMKVKMICKDCDHVQEVPEMFLQNEFDQFIKGVSYVVKEASGIQA